MIAEQVAGLARRRAWLPAIGAVLVLALTTACGSGNGDGALSVGDTASAFSAPAAGGGNVTLTSLTARHDAVVVVFYRGFG